ncbi:MAG: hypothetical protein M3133_05420, partial [Actinomycetota bacterium]|nr:hypothetical protein [Actinomycetota bacterium]
PFVEVPEPLFLHREHEDRSVYRQPDHRSRELWFDPGRPRLSLPMWKLTSEMARAIGRAPLDWSERMRCHLLMLEWVRRHWLHLLKNPFGAVKHVLSSPRPERLGRAG